MNRSITARLRPAPSRGLARWLVRLAATLLALGAFAAPVLADSHPAEEATPTPQVDSQPVFSAIVQRQSFTQPDESLAHNVPDLLVTIAGEEVSCDFLTHYKVSGGITRWGYATSEVIEEWPGALTQYYQRGVVDCQPREGGWRVERRLVWDYVGGGLGDSTDLGAEPDLLSEQPGLELGPWGHRVSNLAVDGTPTGFLDFFDALGGLQAFGHPKSEARLDEDPGAMLNIDGADPGVIRQYFQAAVLEHHPGAPEPVALRFLGDGLRDILYPYGSHQALQSFQSVQPLRYGQTYVPEGTSVRAALVTLYEATDGANWNKNTNWLSDAPLGEWYGVTTDDDGRVVELILSQNQLSGEMPAVLGRLTDLEWLSLWGNQLQGEIPPTIGSLDNVHTLSLWANQLRGTIPAELGNMASLEWVALGINELTGSVPPELGNLANLTHIDFTLNQLSGEVPPELGNLTNLVWLGFWSNRLSGEIPPELGNLTNLERLDFDFNRLTGEIPPELGDLVNLERLYLHNNRLSGEIPPELGNLVNLILLDLHDNVLSGDIPPELGNLVNLRLLGLGGNQLTGCIPAGLAEVPNSDLDELDLPFCGAEGPTQG